MRPSLALLLAPVCALSLACQRSPVAPSTDDSSILRGSAWDEKITGGGEGVAAGNPIWVTASATDDVSSGARGQVTYNYPTLNRDWHGTVECVTVFDSPLSAVIAGPISANGGSSPTGGEWFVMAIKEGGEGSGDTFRFRTMSQSDAAALCAVEESSFPGLIVDGNFNIRTK